MKRYSDTLVPSTAADYAARAVFRNEVDRLADMLYDRMHGDRPITFDQLVWMEAEQLRRTADERIRKQIAELQKQLEAL